MILGLDMRICWVFEGKKAPATARKVLHRRIENWVWVVVAG
jgi:hypothetical protein